MVRPTHTSIEKTRNELAKIRASVNMTHTVLSEGKKFRYTAAIMMAGEYRKRVTSLDTTWKFTNPTKPETYDQSIRTLTAKLTKSRRRRRGSYDGTIMKFILESKTCGRGKTLNPTMDCGSRKPKKNCSSLHKSS